VRREVLAARPLPWRPQATAHRDAAAGCVARSPCGRRKRRCARRVASARSPARERHVDPPARRTAVRLFFPAGRQIGACESSFSAGNSRWTATPSHSFRAVALHDPQFGGNSPCSYKYFMVSTLLTAACTTS
jgi:hypothetical protein